MGIICLYVLIQKSGQKTAKSHLCALWGWNLATQQSANSHAHHMPVAPAWHRDVSNQLLCTMYDTGIYF